MIFEYNAAGRTMPSTPMVGVSSDDRRMQTPMVGANTGAQLPQTPMVGSGQTTTAPRPPMRSTAPDRSD
ncbi:hypothetical protein OB905_05140 [Halobacteria archaeon AArc-dxtr1]|nr:hypothetical protein [Halobacteria archaeon AArc-dxtr1]